MEKERVGRMGKEWLAGPGLVAFGARWVVMLVAVAMAMTTFIPLLRAQEAEAELALQELTAPELHVMLEEKRPMVLINSLSRIEFDGVHIPGSINIPVVEMDKPGVLPADKNTVLVFYCMGKK